MLHSKHRPAMKDEDLYERGVERAILKSAVERDVPIYAPAFTDSELGLDLAIFNRMRAVIERLERDPVWSLGCAPLPTAADDRTPAAVLRCRS